MNLDRYTLGESETDIELTTAEENRAVALELLRQARREVYIATYDLDAPVFSNAEFVEALSAFVRDNSRAHAHILLQKPDKAVKQGHRLIPLAQRLSSSIHIHRPGPEHSDYFETFMVVDGIGYFKRQLADRYEGIAAFKAPIIARDLRDLFLTMWERSSPESQVRRLQI
jgi:hypothetical protein